MFSRLIVRLIAGLALAAGLAVGAAATAGAAPHQAMSAAKPLQICWPDDTGVC
jgi:hypothetical protein